MTFSGWKFAFPNYSKSDFCYSPNSFNYHLTLALYCKERGIELSPQKVQFEHFEIISVIINCMNDEKIKKIFYEYYNDETQNENKTRSSFGSIPILIILFSLFMAIAFGFPTTTIKCDRNTNQCKVYRNFFFKPINYGYKHSQFHIVSIDKIQNAVTWQGSGPQTPNLGYNIGFELKDSKKNTFYGKERGDIHIRCYSLTRKTADNFTTEFNQFLNNNEINKFNKTYIPLPIIEFFLIILFTVLFKFHKSGIILVEDKEKYSLKEEIEIILIYTIVLLLPVIFITFTIASFL